MKNNIKGLSLFEVIFVPTFFALICIMFFLMIQENETSNSRDLKSKIEIMKEELIEIKKNSLLKIDG